MHLNLEVGLAVAVDVARDDGDVGVGVVFDLQLARLVVEPMRADELEDLNAAALLGVDVSEIDQIVLAAIDAAEIHDDVVVGALGI